MMTLKEVSNAFRGYSDKVEREYKTSWEQTRWLGSIQANVFSGKKKINPTDLLKFPWEAEVHDRSEEIELIKERRKWLQEH